MKVCSLASGSRGNSTFLESKDTKVLIDCGISATSITKKLGLIGVESSEISAIFLTHSHSDHISGLDCFLRNNKHISVYGNTKVLDAVEKILGYSLIGRKEITGEVVYHKDLTVEVFELCHDVACYGYSFFEDGTNKFSLLTDCGEVTEKMKGKISGSKLLFIESNYNDVLIERNAKYPEYVKNRIQSKVGHLSNKDCGKLLAEILTDFKMVGLAHLSHNNNTAKVAKYDVLKHLNKKGLVEDVNFTLDVLSQSDNSKMYMV